VLELVFFSNNKNKIKEVSNYFVNTGIEILSLNDLKKIESPQETGVTFEENAQIKSSYCYNIFKKKCFSDDSGLCIEAMNGEPGIYSKNFIQKHKNIKLAFEKIFLEVKKKNNFNAFFQTSICLKTSKEESVFFKGIIRGTISKTTRGLDGFGYDPIFIPNGYKKTFGEMSIAEKNLISHRSMAIKKLKNFLTKSI